MHQNKNKTNKTPVLHWIIVIGILAAVIGFGSNFAKGEETTGHVLAGFDTCMSNSGISEDAAKFLAVWIKIRDKAIAFEEGTGPNLTANELKIGTLIAQSSLCGKMAGTFPVVIIDKTDGYVLFKFDTKLGWGEDTWLVYREGVAFD